MKKFKVITTIKMEYEIKVKNRDELSKKMKDEYEEIGEVYGYLDNWFDMIDDKIASGEEIDWTSNTEYEEIK
jgi:hypothetical protein